MSIDATTTNTNTQASQFSANTAEYGSVMAASLLISAVQNNSEAGATLANYISEALNAINQEEEQQEEAIYKEMKHAKTKKYPMYQTEFQKVSQKFQNIQSTLQSDLQSTQTPVTSSTQLIQTLMQIAGAITQFQNAIATLAASST